MAETDLSAWLTVDETAASIGCSKRTVERLGRAKTLEQRLRRQDGTPPVAVYNPDDVERERLARHPEPPPFVLPAGSTGANGHRQSFPETSGSLKETLARVPAGDDLIRGLAVLISKALQSPPSPPVAETVAEKTLWVTVQEAAAILGFPQADVRRLLHDGDLNHRRTGRGGIRIRRKDLEQL